MPGTKDRAVTKTHPVPTLKGLIVLVGGKLGGGPGERHVIRQFHHWALTQPGSQGRMLAQTKQHVQRLEVRKKC